MSTITSKGKKVKSKLFDGTYTVNKCLGDGGQGEVWGAALGARKVALKFYHPHVIEQDKRLETRLKQAIEIGPPSDRFIWPEDLVALPDGKNLGYAMRLLEKDFVGIPSLLTRETEPSFRNVVITCLELAHNFLLLHSKGLCYCDINQNNIFFNPDSGEIRIIDNDNVDIAGSPASVLGTQRFMAPEIVQGKENPNTQTDLHSLAVLMFYMLMIHHPLDGCKELSIGLLDYTAMNMLYGEDATFIFDPNDDSNRPEPGFHDNALEYWPVYPGFIRDLFTRTFTDGIRDPNARIRESEWRSALASLRDSVIYCSKCGLENFYDRTALTNCRQLATNCWNCSTPLIVPPRIKIDDDIVMLTHDAELFTHHLLPNRRYNFSSVLGKVVQHPNDPQIWGLSNRSADKWVVDNGKTLIDIEPGRSIKISNGLKVQFGAVQGEIRF